MNHHGKSLQLVVLAPVLALNMVAGGVLYMLVLWTVDDYANESIRSNLNSLARSAFAIADLQEDRRNREGRSRLIYQMYARRSFEDFAREHDIGLIIEDGGEVKWERLDEAVVDAIRQDTPAAGHGRVRVQGGGDYFIQTRFFEQWNWRLILVKDAAAFEAVVGRVRAIYVGSAVLLLLLTLGLVVWLRQVLVRPISGIARDFVEGRAPEYRGIRELEDLSDSIGEMKRDLEARTLHLETTLESMTDAITVFDPEMNLVAWNEQFVRLYRYPQDFIRDGLNFEEIMRHNLERGDYVNVEPPVTLAGLVKRARNLDPPRFEVDRADGASIEIRRAHMPDGGYVTAYSDITDRKQAEKSELERRKAEEMATLKTRFFAVMSHELRNPINSAIGFLRRVVDKTEGQLSEQSSENLRLALASCDRLVDLTNDILDLTKLEAKRMDIYVTEFAFDRLVNECAQMIEPSAREKDLKVSTKIDTGLKMRSDADHLRKILTNLLSNAVKFTNSGTIEVVATANGHIVCIEVIDTGVGIEAEYILSVFDEFDQGGRQPGGTGLGLAISRELAHLLGGDIAVVSKPGEGSTFTLTVPREHKETKN